MHQIAGDQSTDQEAKIDTKPNQGSESRRVAVKFSPNALPHRVAGPVLVRAVKSSSNACDEVVRCAMYKKANEEPKGENKENVIYENGDPSIWNRVKH